MPLVTVKNPAMLKAQRMMVQARVVTTVVGDHRTARSNMYTVRSVIAQKVIAMMAGTFSMVHVFDHAKHL